MRSRPAAELDAAGIADPAIRAAYATCRQLNAGHGRTYFLATTLLSRDRRPAVHALYGFARYADEIVDDLGDRRSPADRRAALDGLGAELDAALERAPGREPPEPAGRDAASRAVLTAVADTAHRYGIDRALFAAFLASMRMDTLVTDYPTMAELERYMYGSAAVIGLQMLPVLGTVGPRAEAEAPAAALGMAFQLTNFLRDIGEDLDRGRVYLPADELAAFGVDRGLLAWCRERRRTDPRLRAALAHLVARTRAVYRRAEPGIALLAPESRPCIACAAGLYAGILDEIVAADYAVLHRRVVVPNGRRLLAALRWAQASWQARLQAPGAARAGRP